MWPGIEFKVGAGGILTIILTLAKLLGFFPFSWWIVVAPIVAAYVVTFLLISYAAWVIPNE